MQGKASPGAGHQGTGEKEVGGQAAGNTSSSTKRLVLDLGNKEIRDVGTSSASPIPQVDGVGEGRTQNEAEKVIFTFKSDFGEEDITYTIEEIFKDSVDIRSNLMSRVRLKPLKAMHMCTVELKLAAGKKASFSWPDMKYDQREVFQELKRIF